MFQRQIFRRIFFSYIIIIFVCLFVYTTFILYENDIINKERTKRETEIAVDLVTSILKERLLNAQNIVLDLNNSEALKQVYFSHMTNTTLDSYDILSIINELQSKQTSSKLAVDEVIIFLNSNQRAYSSSGGVINMQDTYEMLNNTLPYYKVDTLKELLSLKNSKRFSFSKKYLIYCDNFTYRNGKPIGLVTIMFNLDTLKSDIKKMLNEGYGVVITLNDEDICTVGSTSSLQYTNNSTSIPGISVKLHVPSDSSAKENILLLVMLGVIGVISVFFITMAYYFSKKYYQPIDHIENMMLNHKTKTSPDSIANSSPLNGEMDFIIQEIKNLIGEKNKYKERMLTITPYAHTGILHGMLTGNIVKDSIGILTEDSYLDLINPYFMVSLINFFIVEPSAVLHNHQQLLQDLFNNICSIFSTNERRLVFYNKDSSNVFLIANFDHDESPDDLFYQVHKYIQDTIANDNYLITIGVDDIRDDISSLKEACEGAARALDEMLIGGRGEVYFNDYRLGVTTDYYFPKNFSEKLVKELKKGQIDEIRQLMKEIYRKNWELGGTPEMYHALIDELHLSVIKAIKEITVLNTTHISIEKFSTTATLEEIFSYYETALVSTINSIQETTNQEEKNPLDKEILQYIEDNYCNPDLSLQYLINKFNVSSKYLSLFFKNHYGITYFQYIQNKRIKMAEDLLKTNQYSLSQICSLCGYTNQLTFRRNFKTVTGMNPSDFSEVSGG